VQVSSILNSYEEKVAIVIQQPSFEKMCYTTISEKVFKVGMKYNLKS